MLHRWKCAESALHTFRLIRYVSGDEMETIFLVLGAFSCGRCTHFDILHEPGGYWAGRGRTERRIIPRRVLTSAENHHRKSIRRDNPGAGHRIAQTAPPALSKRWACLASNPKPTASAYL